MPNFNPVTTVNFMMPISSTPSLEPVQYKRNLISDSISSMEGGTSPAWTPERPVLTPPDALPDSVYRFLATTEESRHLGNNILGILGDRLKNIKLKIQEVCAENIQKLQEAARRAADSSFWSILKKIATCLLSALSMVFGVALVASGGGALIGSLMIASGVLSLSNFALSETGAWDWISKQLANDNEERQKTLAWVLPTAVGILAGGIGLVGSIQSIATGALQFAEKAIYIAQTALAIFDGVTTFGKGYADARVTWAQADLSIIQANLTAERTHFDSAMREIESSMDGFKAVKTKTKKTIQNLSQSNIRLTRQA